MPTQPNHSTSAANLTHQVSIAPAAPMIDDLLDASIAAGEFPSAVYAIWHAGAIVYANARGHAVRTPRIINATRDTIYDLASLTKPLVTTLLCAVFIERGTLKLDAPVSHYLPAFYTPPTKFLITVRQLLTHTGGLPAWRPLCLLTKAQSAEALSHIVRLELAYRPGAQVVYSDLGFITLGMMCERLGATSLAELATREIFEPLNLTHTFFNPPASLRETIAASESHGNAYERNMSQTHDTAADDGDDDRASCFRTRPIWGEVHDGNAHFLGGAAGHAGLFSNVAETLALAAQFLPRHSTLLHDPATFRLFDTDMTPDLNEARALGWQLAATPESTAGTSLPPDSFGHLGFTGTSLWIDGANDDIFTLLTNRTHDHPLPFANINRTRRRFHTTASGLIH